MTVDVTVIIVAYNSGSVLPLCLAALAAQTAQPRAIVLVDNGSTDSCVDLFAQKENIRVIRLERNLGFAAANNRGVEAADTTWVALLNPDAFPRPTWLEELLKAAQRHPDAASIGSTQWMHNRPGFLDGAGDADECDDLPGPAHQRDQRITQPGQAEADHSKHTSPPAPAPATHQGVGELAARQARECTDEQRHERHPFGLLQIHREAVAEVAGKKRDVDVPAKADRRGRDAAARSARGYELLPAGGA